MPKLSSKLTFFPKLVIDASLLGVSQDLISLCDLFELFFCISITILVWVELECQLPVGLLDLIFVGFWGDTQDFVEVLARGLNGQTGCVLLRPGALLWKEEQSCIRLAHHILLKKPDKE